MLALKGKQNKSVLRFFLCLRAVFRSLKLVEEVSGPLLSPWRRRLDVCVNTGKGAKF